MRRSTFKIHFILFFTLLVCLQYYKTQSPRSKHHINTNPPPKNINFNIFSNETITKYKSYINQNTTNIITLQLQKKYHQTDIIISIHVFGWKRSNSLNRLLKSLKSAKYSFNKFIPLTIHLDGGYTQKVSRLVDSFVWPFGELEVIKHSKSIGLQEVY